MNLICTICVRARSTLRCVSLIHFNWNELTLLMANFKNVYTKQNAVQTMHVIIAYSSRSSTHITFHQQHALSLSCFFFFFFISYLDFVAFLAFDEIEYVIMKTGLLDAKQPNIIVSEGDVCFNVFAHNFRPAFNFQFLCIVSVSRAV